VEPGIDEAHRSGQSREPRPHAMDAARTAHNNP